MIVIRLTFLQLIISFIFCLSFSYKLLADDYNNLEQNENNNEYVGKEISEFKNSKNNKNNVKRKDKSKKKDKNKIKNKTKDLNDINGDNKDKGTIFPKVDKDGKEIKEKKNKFSYKPSYVAAGFDFFTLIYNLILENQNTSITNVSHFDCRSKVNTDFNRIIVDFSFGFLYSYSESFENGEKNTKKGFFLNPNIYYNFLKKNSEKNTIFAGGGFNFNRSNFKFENPKDSNKNFKEVYYHIWFNVEAGCKTKIISILHGGVNLKFNFLKFKLKTKSDFSNTRSASFDPFIYGFGAYNASYNIEFSIYLFLSINLFEDINVVRRESFSDL